MNLKIGEPVSVSFPIGVGVRKAGFNLSPLEHKREQEVNDI